jgi:DNA primase
MRSLFGEDLKRRVRDATEIMDLIRSYGVELKRAGRNWKGLCPFHQEKTPSFNVNPEGQYYKCFGCSKSGDVFSFVMAHERVEFPDALRLLADRANIQVEVDPAAVAQAKKDGDWKSYLYRLNGSAASYYREQLKGSEGERARAYLAKRGISEEMWEVFGLGYAPASGAGLVRQLQAQRAPVKALDRAGLVGLRDDGTAYDYFRDRLMFPICDQQGRVIGFGGRVLGEGEPKYLNTRETFLFSKGRSIYGLHLAREAIVEQRRAVLVEGYTDVIMSHQFGFKNVVAALGTAVTADHTRVLRRMADEVDLLLDSDSAGANAAERSLVVFFQEALSARIVRLPGAAKDPCDFLLASGREAFEQALTQRQDLFDFKFGRVAAVYDLRRPDGIAKAAKELMDLVSLSPDPVRRAAYRRDVASRLNLPEQELRFVQPVKMAAPDHGGAEEVARPEHTLAGVEREVLRWLFHQPAWILTAVGEVDLTGFTGVSERLIAKALLSAVDAGRLPPNAPDLTPDSHSLSGLVAREALTGLSSAMDLFAGKVVDEGDLDRARAVCVQLAEESPQLGKTAPEEYYRSLISDLSGTSCEHQLGALKATLAAARSRGDEGEARGIEKQIDEIERRLPLSPIKRKTVRRVLMK